MKGSSVLCELQKQQQFVGLTTFATSLKSGVCVHMILGLTRRILPGITVLSELPTFWMSTGSFMPGRLSPLRLFWTRALIILLENKTCHLAATVTQVLTAFSFLQLLNTFCQSSWLDAGMM